MRYDTFPCSRLSQLACGIPCSESYIIILIRAQPKNRTHKISKPCVPPLHWWAPPCLRYFRPCWLFGALRFQTLWPPSSSPRLACRSPSLWRRGRPLVPLPRRGRTFISFRSSLVIIKQSALSSSPKSLFAPHSPFSEGHWYHNPLNQARQKVRCRIHKMWKRKTHSSPNQHTSGWSHPPTRPNALSSSATPWSPPRSLLCYRWSWGCLVS